MSKNQTAFLQDLLTELVKNTLTLALGFIFSTALIGGASYLLFNTQKDVDEINKLAVEAQKMTAEGKIYYDMTKIFSEGFVTTNDQLKEVEQIFLYLGLCQNQDKLDKTYIETSLNSLTSMTLRLTREKGKISGFTPTDKLIVERKATYLEFYDNLLAVTAETYALIDNWENLTPEDRNKRLLGISELYRKSLEIVNKLEIQSEQIVYDIEHVKYTELDQLEAEVVGKQRQLRLKTTFSWFGVIAGSIMFLSLGFYALKIRSVQKSVKRKSKTG